MHGTSLALCVGWKWLAPELHRYAALAAHESRCQRVRNFRAKGIYYLDSNQIPCFQCIAMKSSLVLFAFTLLVASFVAPATAQHEASDSSGVPPPWDLTHQEPGEPSWAPLLRIRDVESVYRESEKWWGIYAQLRAQAEAAGGNHAAALRFWDAPRRSRDSVGTLPEGVRAAAALNVLSEAADTARVIMINERHHAASDRLLTLRLLPILYEKGYRYFAAEALSYRDSTLNERTYPVDATGGYTDEPVFAAVIREALRLGYRLVPYEITDAQREVKNDLTRQQRRDQIGRAHV